MATHLTFTTYRDQYVEFEASLKACAARRGLVIAFGPVKPTPARGLFCRKALASVDVVLSGSTKEQSEFIEVLRAKSLRVH